MLTANITNNRLLIPNVNQNIANSIKMRVNSSDVYKIRNTINANVHIPITAYSVAQLANALRELKRPIQPSIEALRIIYQHYNSLQDIQFIKKEDNLPQPAIRKTDAWNHQLQAYHFAMKAKTVMLDMGVGTGKTKTTVDILQNIEARRNIIVMPKYILDDVNAWAKQFRIHSNNDYELLTLNKGSVKQKAELLATTLKRIGKSKTILHTLINYETLWREPLASMLLKSDTTNSAVVFDESHRIKSHNSKTSEYSHKLALKFDYRLCLTGTMMDNSPLDVFGQFRALDVGIFGHRWIPFRDTYAEIFDHDGVPIITGYKNLDILGNKIYPLTYHASSEVLQLPEPIHDTRHFQLSSEEMKMYRELAKTFGLELKQGTLSVANKLSLILRLQQLTGGCLPLETDDTGEMTQHRLSFSKANALKEVLNDLSPKEKIVIFYRFNADADAIWKVCKELKRRTGEISGRRNDKPLWDADQVDIILLNVRSGEGIDLHQANYGIAYSLGYKFTQCLGRIQRPPRKQTAYIIHLVASGTADELVYKSIANKTDVVNEVESYFINN